MLAGATRSLADLLKRRAQRQAVYQSGGVFKTPPFLAKSLFEKCSKPASSRGLSRQQLLDQSHHSF